MESSKRRRSMIPVVPPQLISDIFTDDENARMMDILRTKGPWRLIQAIHFNSAEEMLAVSSPSGGREEGVTLSDLLTPAFRGSFGDNGVPYIDEAHDIFYSRRLLDRVLKMHGARYGAPYTFVFNINAPSYGLDPGHVDGRSWRGLEPTTMPAWLGAVMAKSGLFGPWEVKAGQVIAWYYNSDIDGGFTYWPDGPDRAPQRLSAPIWNRGLVTENHRMFHRGEASGPPEKRDMAKGMTLNSMIEAEGEDGWRIIDGDRVLARYEANDMRMLFHYSAHVFTDMADLKRFYDHTDDLKIEQALDMLIADMKANGMPVEVPTDPLSDPDFISALTVAYASTPTSYHPDAPLQMRSKITA